MSVPLLDVNAQNLPLVGELESAFTRVLLSGRFIFGDEMEAFERECAAMIGVQHALSVSSGTDALILALMAMGIAAGDEVICPSFTFFATAGCIYRLGAVPVFCDVNETSFCLSIQSVEKKITPRTKAIIPVHLFGQCANMDEIRDFADKHALFVLEDCAQAIGASHRGRQAGTIGHIGAFSFFPSKNLGGFGDGGMVTTNDSVLAKKMAELRNHGMEPKYYHRAVGGNFRLDALQCALLRVKLPHYSSYVLRRQQNAAFYLDSLSNIDEVILPSQSEHCNHTWNQFTLRIKNGKRNALKEYLLENKIGVEIYYPVPLHRQQCFESLPTESLNSCEVSDMLADEVISIPIYPELETCQKEEVVGVIHSFFK